LNEVEELPKCGASEFVWTVDPGRKVSIDLPLHNIVIQGKEYILELKLSKAVDSESTTVVDLNESYVSIDRGDLRSRGRRKEGRKRRIDSSC
jgi:hypothetical protein